MKQDQELTSVDIITLYWFIYGLLNNYVNSWKHTVMNGRKMRCKWCVRKGMASFEIPSQHLLGGSMKNHRIADILKKNQTRHLSNTSQVLTFELASQCFPYQWCHKAYSSALQLQMCGMLCILTSDISETCQRKSFWPQ
jgi:hypothetical protein